MHQVLRTTARDDGVIVRRRETAHGIRYTTYEVHEDVMRRLDSFGQASPLSQRASRKLLRLGRRKMALERLRAGDSVKAIAIDLGVSEAAVRNYRLGRR